MNDVIAEDLLSIDRDVARVARDLARWRVNLAADCSECPSRCPDLGDPFDSARHVAGKSIWDALGRLSLGAGESMHRDALRRWVYSLIQARTGLGFEIAVERAKAEPRGHINNPAPRLVSYSEAWRGVLGSTTDGLASEWLAAAADSAAGIADVGLRRSARRAEVARRLGLDDPGAPLATVDAGRMRTLAAKVLEVTDDVWQRVTAEALGSQAVAASVFRCAVARDASDGWPAQLSMHWIANVTGMGPNRVVLEPFPLPTHFGAASFVRAMYSAGFSARVALSQAGLPFALARDPQFVAGHQWALAFSSLASTETWQTRELNLGRRTASAQVRRLTHSALFELRVQAARVLLGDDMTPPSSSLFEELGVRLIGLPLDGRLRGVWPRARDDDPARLIAWLQAPRFVDGLRESFDIDWYRNPRTWAHLRDLAARPAREEVDPDGLDDGARILALAFESALG